MAKKKKKDSRTAEMFNKLFNIAPAGKESADPYSDIAMGMVYIAIGGICYWLSRSNFTRVLWILMSIVAAYQIIRGIIYLVRHGVK